VVPKHEAPATQPAKTGSPPEALANLEASLQSAQKAADAGDAKTAAAELAKAQKALAALKEQLKAPSATHVSKPVNALCPIMGGKVDPDKTPAELTRQFQGQTVGFCCGGCPASWDRLTDEQKAAKLAKLAPKADPAGAHAGQPH
jgi:hypothetical protein